MTKALLHAPAGLTSSLILSTRPNWLAHASRWDSRYCAGSSEM